MSYLSGFDYLTTSSSHAEMISADYTHWRIHAYRNFEKVLKLILLFSCPEKPECIFCEKNSLNYSSLGSLAAHYRYSHKTQCVYHYIDEIIKISPQKMEKLYEKNGSKIIEAYVV